jgi:intracellular septation protein A
MNLDLIILCMGFIALAYWRQTRFLKIVAGFLSLAFGGYIISVSAGMWIYWAVAVAYMVNGLYLLLTSGSSRS